MFPIIEYTLKLNLKDDSWASRAAADQQARTLTYDPQQQFTADELFEVPPDPVQAEQPAAGQWQGPAGVPLGALRPAGVARIYVLGGCAGVPRPQAEKLLRPVALIGLGTRVGKVAAAEARSLKAPQGVRLPAEQKGTVPFCRNGPEGASHKRGLSPFSARARLDGILAETTGESSVVP